MMWTYGTGIAGEWRRW